MVEIFSICMVGSGRADSKSYFPLGVPTVRPIKFFMKKVSKYHLDG